MPVRSAMRGLSKDQILIPTLQIALNDPDFSGFEIKIEPFQARPPDGYFHPSTHATWNVRQLALYLIAPHLIKSEQMELTSVFAITQGHFWHMFIQHVLTTAGPLIDTEVGFVDQELRRTGHMDGLLDIRGQREGLEIKTINSFKINKVTSERELREHKPEYWAQAQEYLDVFGLPRMRFLLLAPTYPFTMKEFTVEADPVYQERRRAIYHGAIQIAEATNKLPLPEGGCCRNPSSCPVRSACKYKET